MKISIVSVRNSSTQKQRRVIFVIRHPFRKYVGNDETGHYDNNRPCMTKIEEFNQHERKEPMLFELEQYRYLSIASRTSSQIFVPYMPKDK